MTALCKVEWTWIGVTTSVCQWNENQSPKIILQFAELVQGQFTVIPVKVGKLWPLLMTKKKTEIHSCLKDPFGLDPHCCVTIYYDMTSWHKEMQRTIEAGSLVQWVYHPLNTHGSLLQMLHGTKNTETWGSWCKYQMCSACRNTYYVHYQLHQKTVKLR